MSDRIGDLIIRECRAEAFRDCELIFSGLDSDVAGEIETEFWKAEFCVFSNAKNHRLDPLVPLVIPTANVDHLKLIAHQQAQRKLGRGFLVCNSNCAIVGVAVPLAALQAQHGPITQVSVVTMQAVSGAGYPGVSSMDIVDNVVPFIAGEEEKLEPEARKILGALAAHGDDEAVAIADQAELKMSVACNRVPVLDGHLACVSLRFDQRPPPSPDQVKRTLREYVPTVRRLKCPSAPRRAIIVTDDPDRPQPRLDRDAENGYTVTVGRVRHDRSGIFDIQFVALSHNTIIGAAGASIMNAEAAMMYGYIW
ncbi:MAG: hypothetical protein M1826_005767 [Phylliscum demangeonii]|nr:MAG: hypothetical protein M1826_005767 [Phylliscum demangeonii]